MGVFTVSLEIESTGTRPKTAKIGDVMVDTGSEVTWLPAELLKDAGVRIRKKDQGFVLANGTAISRDIGYAILRCGEFETIDEVVFAKEGDLHLLGARTLEGFNARVDPMRRRLVAAGPHPAVGNAKVRSKTDFTSP